VHRGEVRQVTFYDLCAEPPQGFGALILTPNQGAHLVPLCEQEFGDLLPMPPTAPAAPVTRIGLSCLCFVVMSLIVRPKRLH